VTYGSQSPANVLEEQMSEFPGVDFATGFIHRTFTVFRLLVDSV
jgi:hypothetical protein